MKKLLSFLTVLTVFTVSLGTQSQYVSEWPIKWVNKLHAPTVVILTELDEDQGVLGTGVIIDKRGVILTASHVIDIADPLRRLVFTKTGQQYAYEVVGMNRLTDLAVLRIVNSAQNFPYAKLQKSNR